MIIIRLMLIICSYLHNHDWRLLLCRRIYLQAKTHLAVRVHVNICMCGVRV
uniref:Uncharacterized protein n=1 Tax=Octopus bimaculoides TaxID=37653 RepID=A0A0L8HWB4_OCTBM